MNGSTVTRTNFNGWDAVQLKNGLIDATAVPEIGGRLMQFKLGIHDFLFKNPELLGQRFTFEEHAGDGTIVKWKNYGGEKTWPAPQGWDRADQWPGPPDPVLDGGPYTFEVDETNGSLTMISPPEKQHTGLRNIRKLTLPPYSARLQFDFAFENVIDRPIQWSIWQVAQLNCARYENGVAKLDDNCWLYIPKAEEHPYHIMFGEKNEQYHEDIVPDLMAVRYEGIVGKIGVTNTAGWMAFANQTQGYVLCIQFDYDDTAQYPDNGSSIECWTESPGAPSPVPIKSPGYIMEVEALSPLHVLQPGETANFKVTWSATQCPGPIIDVTDLGCTHQALTIAPSGDYTRITGVFGCFETGHVELVWVDSHNNILGQKQIGSVSPLRALNVDQIEMYPQDATCVRLDFIRTNGNWAGVLASAAID